MVIGMTEATERKRCLSRERFAQLPDVSRRTSGSSCARESMSAPELRDAVEIPYRSAA
jgi:hypothetical protein